MSSEHTVVINGTAHKVTLDCLDGLQIRALGALAPGDDVVLEGKGDEPDRVLGDDDVVALTQGPIQLFSRPPTMFGSAL